MTIYADSAGLCCVSDQPEDAALAAQEAAPAAASPPAPAPPAAEQPAGAAAAAPQTGAGGGSEDPDFIAMHDTDDSDMDVAQEPADAGAGSTRAPGDATAGAAAGSGAAAPNSSGADLAAQELDFIPLTLSDDEADDPAAAARGGAEVPSTSGRDFGYRPPWLGCIGILASPSLRLHNEIVTFAKMLEPTEQEAASRKRSVDAVEEVVRGIWPEAEVKVFGSFATGEGAGCGCARATGAAVWACCSVCAFRLVCVGMDSKGCRRQDA